MPMAEVIRGSDDKNQEAEKPLLVCIPGLLGGGGDFRVFEEELSDCCRLLPFDPNAARSIKSIQKSEIDSVDYMATGPEIIRMVDSIVGPTAKFYALGISIGGKVVYDLAIRYSDRLLGGIVTDTGPGSVIGSGLYNYVLDRVKSLDMDRPWREIRDTLKVLFPENTMRVLVQTQIAFNATRTKATWREGMKNLEGFLVHQSLDDQWDAFEKIDAEMAAQGRYIHLLHALRLSAISPDDYKKLRTFKSLRFTEVPDAIHFIHVDYLPVLLDTIRATIGAPAKAAVESPLA
jgi:pimeloyl-ACP methyl ester carboxylesterase